MIKCKGCEKEARTPKGWCSGKCYQKNQALVENKGRKLTGHITPEETKKKLSSISKLWHKTHPIESKQIINALSNPKYNSLKGHPKECHPNWKGGEESANCKHCQTPFLRSRYKINKGLQIFCSRSCYDEYRKIHTPEPKRRVKYVEKQCAICGKTFEVPPCRKTAKFCSIKCHNINNLHTMSNKRTTIELKLKEILEQLKLSFKEQYIISNITISDFFIEPNIVLFADGRYWHDNPEAIEKDSKINNRLKDLGFKVIRFWEEEINSEEHKIKQILMEAII